ncbi:signal peptidase I [Buchnera aphidicola]|uniref:signal peptidase I n=1 Tax=Buchnera aphidicola TaxID=9 RepID=UPI0034645935
MSDILAIMFFLATLITAIFWLINKHQYNKFNKKKDITFGDKINHHDFFKKNRYIEYIASFFPIFITIFVVRSFIYEPFQIPSGSMIPTLLIGDFVLVEKFSYGIKDPIFHYTLMNVGKPRRGDIVVFRHPYNKKINYIKRVIGLPGDRITYNTINKMFTIHQECNNTNNCKKEIFVSHKSYILENFKKYNTNDIRNRKDVTFYYSNNKDEKINPLLFHLFQEKIDKKVFDILLSNQIRDQLNEYYQQPGQKKGIWIVPKDQYFMIGDNRDNSLDSRYWGFVPDKNLIGKATIIWMSFDKEEHKWPVGIRLNRIGKIN